MSDPKLNSDLSESKVLDKSVIETEVVNNSPNEKNIPMTAEEVNDFCFDEDNWTPKNQNTISITRQQSEIPLSQYNEIVKTFKSTGCKFRISSDKKNVLCTFPAGMSNPSPGTNRPHRDEAWRFSFDTSRDSVQFFRIEIMLKTDSIKCLV